MITHRISNITKCKYLLSYSSYQSSSFYLSVHAAGKREIKKRMKKNKIRHLNARAAASNL